MIEHSRLALNHILCPSLTPAAFCALAGELGVGQVELRNDLGAADPLGGLAPAELRARAADAGVRVISINALQRFNLAAARAEVERTLDQLLALARALGCGALVLCPTNDPADPRSPVERQNETVAALRALRPRFEDAGVLGLVEPLGFAESSLRSLVDAQAAIRAAGGQCYRVVHDTFHHHLGPDTLVTLGDTYDVALTGLVHLSAVVDEVPDAQLRDRHRVLPSAGDRLGSVAQLARLAELGYRGPVSLEPFAPSVQALAPAALRAALAASLALVAEAGA